MPRDAFDGDDRTLYIVDSLMIYQAKSPSYLDREEYWRIAHASRPYSSGSIDAERPESNLGVDLLK